MFFNKKKKNFRDGIYEGEMNNQKLPHGHGKLTYIIGGDSYDGEWINGKRHGHGVCEFDNGDVYDGEWQHDIMCGYGLMKYDDGGVYDGFWKNGQRHGNGRFTDCIGNIYTGDWAYGYQCGHGVNKYDNGDIYDGLWSHGKRSGRGRQNYSNGDVYDGEWINDKRHGNGVYKLISGSSLEGQWKNDYKEGEFIFTTTSGRQEKQLYKDDKLISTANVSSEVTIAFQGGTYTGEVNDNNQPDGQGKLKYADGRVYNGEFKDGKRSGNGVLTFADGSEFNGEWINGKQSGGVFKLKDGRILESKWTYSSKEGAYIYTYPDGRQEKQLYNNDKLIDTILVASTVSKIKSASNKNISAVRVTSDSKAPTVSAEDSEALVTALKKISKRFGTECFRKGGKAAAALNDMLPGAGFARQRRRVVTAMNTGACDILFNERETDIQLRINKAYNCLLENDMAEAAAEETVNALAAVIIDE